MSIGGGYKSAEGKVNDIYALANLYKGGYLVKDGTGNYKVNAEKDYESADDYNKSVKKFNSIKDANDFIKEHKYWALEPVIFVHQTEDKFATGGLADAGVINQTAEFEITVPKGKEYCLDLESNGFDFVEYISDVLTKNWYGNGRFEVRLVKETSPTSVIVSIKVPNVYKDKFEVFEFTEFLTQKLTKKWFGHGWFVVDIVSNALSISKHWQEQGVSFVTIQGSTLLACGRPDTQEDNFGGIKQRYDLYELPNNLSDLWLKEVVKGNAKPYGKLVAYFDGKFGVFAPNEPPQYLAKTDINFKTSI